MLFVNVNDFTYVKLFISFKAACKEKKVLFEHLSFFVKTITMTV